MLPSYGLRSCALLHGLCLSQSLLSSPVFPSPPLCPHLLPCCLVDNMLWLVGNNVLVASISGLTRQLAVPWWNAWKASYNCLSDFCASLLSSWWFFKTSLEFHVLKLYPCAESGHWDFWAQRLMLSLPPPLPFLTYFSVVSLPQNFGNRTV